MDDPDQRPLQKMGREEEILQGLKKRRKNPPPSSFGRRPQRELKRQEAEGIVRLTFVIWAKVTSEVIFGAERMAADTPPVSFLADLLLPAGQAEDFQANLEGFWPRWVERHGVGKARLLWRKELALVIIKTWIGGVSSFLVKALKLIGS